MKAIAYLRCSTSGRATEGVSLETQEDAIRRYAEYKGLKIVGSVTDAGISGGVNKAREGFVLLLDRIQAGDVEAVILFSVERLSRDMLTCLALERFLEEYNVQVHTVEGQLDTSTPDGFMNFAMRAFMGEMERRQVKYRTKRALQFKRANGQVAGHTPFGYRRVDKDLIPDASEQAVVKKANQLYRRGLRLVEIVATLNKDSATRNGKPWTARQVRRLITGYKATYRKESTRVGLAARRFIEAIA